VTKEVQRDIEGGKALSEALAKHPKVFSYFFINMVKAGEIGGVLDTVLLRVAEHYEKESELKRRIKSAMAYPTAMFGLILALASAMIIFVVPIFAKMFEQFGSELPAPTRMLVNMSNFMTTKWYIILAVIAGLVYLFRKYKATEAGRLNVDKIKLKLPVVGILSRKLAVSRFSRTLGTLVSSGVPILQALDITADTAGNAVVARAVRQTRASIKEGETIARPLSASDVFPPMVVQMVAVGEETGALDTMLQKVADFYEAEVSSTVEALTSMIEPLMIAVMGLIVGGMLVALYMPMFSIITEMGGT
ncbi:MAG: type II secretion system F family protein, partial [Candidatus Subteraquimicrobiales bacterium]|nr:type II secretion system F family protein [Candidatus Subteraquimicrobiales bacterium]